MYLSIYFFSKYFRNTIIISCHKEDNATTDMFRHLVLNEAEDEPAVLICSRVACECDARYKIIWQNQKIHGTERFKTWLSCDEHLNFLETFLRSRNFVVIVEKI